MRRVWGWMTWPDDDPLNEEATPCEIFTFGWALDLVLQKLPHKEESRFYRYIQHFFFFLSKARAQQKKNTKNTFKLFFQAMKNFTKKVHSTKGTTCAIKKSLYYSQKRIFLLPWNTHSRTLQAKKSLSLYSVLVLIYAIKLYS